MFYAVRACAEAVPLYPIYALLFADRGLSAGEISSLFAIWSVVAFAAEIPSGALADTWSRKRLYALGELLTAAGYALWLLWPTYAGFAAGFVLWGVGGALGSGSLEALLYDELEAADRADDYARIAGRAGTVEILAMLAATLLAAPALATGGYLLVGAASIAVKTLGAALALRLPENRPDGTDSDPSYLVTLRSGVRAAVSDRRIVFALLVAALVPGFSALDEYLPLLSREMGAGTGSVPLLFAVTALAMAAGSASADRFPGRAALPVALIGAAVLLAGGALAPHVSGMVAVSAAFGLLQFAMVRAESRLQDSITGSARSTVLSVAGFAAEVCAVALYGLFALPAALPALFAVCALPLVVTALIASRSR